MSILRKATFAGSWYPGKASIVKERIANWFSEVKVTSSEIIKGIIVPHAGWTYSGRIAAESFAHLQGKDIRRIIILGPCHRYYSQYCLLTNTTELETPQGILDVDVDAINRLKDTGLFSTCSMKNECNEHSLEIELPFVYELFGSSAKVVMIMVGNVNEEQKNEYAKVLAPFMKDPQTAFIISSDFCHWGYNFEYTYYDRSKGKIWESISALDHEGVQWIEQQNADGFSEYMNRTETTICGHNCIEIYLRTLKESGLTTKTELLRYGQSNQVQEEDETSVSYCALRTILTE